jgi:uncharacterized protein (TIGR00255 family)
VLLSMTGFGEARRQNDRLAITVELKSVNNKHLKVSIRTPDAYLSLEHDLEKLVRAGIGRGSVYVNVYADRLDRTHDQGIDGPLLRQYWEQIADAARDLKVSPPPDLGPLLALPGVVIESRHHLVEDEDWPLIAEAMQGALESLQVFRTHEGTAMASELSQLCDAIDQGVEKVAVRAPGVVAEYRDKVLDRVQGLLGESGMRVQESDLIREVSLFADRCDITEEITRLRCHIGQFRTQLAADQSPGRKLDFLCQEMFREVNTIGSKANDVPIAHIVVDLKTHVEKMREIVQNIE